MTDLQTDHLRKARDAVEYYYARGWTDGLPVVPPIREFVDEFLAQTPRSPDEVLCRLDHLNRQCTVQEAAINAILAGCRPEYFPIVIAALQAFGNAGPSITQSTTGHTPILILNGPIRHETGINCTHNILGPGDRANATIGRTIRLIVLNVLDIRPHDLDQSTHGTPGKYTVCFGENEEESPWDPFHVELGFPIETSTATVRMARSTLHVEQRSTSEPELILRTIADTMSYAGGIYEAPPFNRNSASLVVMGPEHANIIAEQGWSKADVRQFLWQHWGKSIGELRLFGKTHGIETGQSDDFIRNGDAENIKIVVSGANNAGISTVMSGFSVHQSTYSIDDERVGVKTS